MMEWINNNVALIISTFGLGSLLTAATTMVRMFSQKRMTRLFDTLNSGSVKINNATFGIENSTNGLKNEIQAIRSEIKNAVESIKNWREDPLLMELNQTLSDLNVLKETLDYKDRIIDAYAKDIQAIKIVLMKLNGEGGTNDILQDVQKAQDVVPVEPVIDNDNVGDGINSILEDQQDRTTDELIEDDSISGIHNDVGDIDTSVIEQVEELIQD